MKKKLLLFIIASILILPNNITAASGKTCKYTSDKGVSTTVNIKANKNGNLSCSANITGWPNKKKLNKKVSCGYWTSGVKNEYLSIATSRKEEICPYFILVSYDDDLLFDDAELFLYYSKEPLEKKQKEISNESYILTSPDYKKQEAKKKENCSDYSYDDCMNIKDKKGNICIKDKTTKTCRKKTSCGDFTTKSTCPSKSDVSKCKWDESTKKCKKYDIFVCTDYNDKGSCPKKDEEGKACKWDSKKGCVYKNKSNSSTSSSSNSNSQTKSTLSKICSETGVLKSVRFLGYILFIVKIVVPIILIIMGSLDFGKAITTSNQDGLTKATKNLAVRVVAGVIIFILPTIVNFLFGMIVGLNKDYEDEMEGFNGCRTCLFSPDKCNINK